MSTTTFIRRFDLAPSEPTDITAAVTERVARADVPEGLVTVAAAGGGASVVVLADKSALASRVPAAAPGASLTLPIINRAVTLDDGMGIYLLEHGPADRERAVAIVVTGETDQDG